MPPYVTQGQAKDEKSCFVLTWMVNVTTVYETEASSTSNCQAIFICLSKKPLFISAFDNKSKATRSCIQCDKPSRRRLTFIIIQNTGTEKFKIMAYVSECTYTQSNSSKEIANYLLLELVQLTTQDKNCMSCRYFLRGSVIHILRRNKFIFTPTSYSILLLRYSSS